jgi:putative membrane protein
MQSADSEWMPMSVSDRLAVDRTRLAYERTLMAWVRTAVSMISFGFTIYKFFQFELDGRPFREGDIMGPRGFAIMMISIGLLALLLSTIQHRQSLQGLRAEYGGSVPLSLATLVAGLFSALGLIALVAVVLRQ